MPSPSPPAAQVTLGLAPAATWSHQQLPDMESIPEQAKPALAASVPSAVAPPSTLSPALASAPAPAPPSVPRTKICVYCGAESGNNPIYLEAARELARAMAQQNIDLVYGGGTVGLMGELAKTMVSLAGPDSVHGIIPEALIKHERDSTYQTVANDNTLIPAQHVYGRTTVVKDMHSRKQRMAQEVFDGGPGSGFIGLSGGFGTLEEVLETVTWNQLGIHQRGICLLNVGGYFDGLLTWIATAVRDGFIRSDNGGILVTAPDAAGAIRALREYKVSPATLKLEWGKQ